MITSNVSYTVFSQSGFLGGQHEHQVPCAQQGPSGGGVHGESHGRNVARGFYNGLIGLGLGDLGIAVFDETGLDR